MEVESLRISNTKIKDDAEKSKFELMKECNGLKSYVEKLKNKVNKQ